MLAPAGELTPVDVVIVSWNVREELLACIESVLASQGVSPRVVVVDNDSADGSADAVAERFPGVRLIRNPDNRGFAAAANQGMASGSAPLVMLLNPDCRLGERDLARLADRLGDLPRHALVVPRLLHEDGTPQHSVYLFPSLRVALLLALGLDRLMSRGARSRLLLEGSWESDVERDVPWAIGAAWMMRRSTLDELGPFDERYFVYVEDLDWCDRARRAGLAIRFVPSVSVTHLGNRSGRQRYGADRVAAYSRNTMAWARRHRGRPWAWAFAAINGSATVLRYLAWRLATAIRPTSASRERVSAWRPYARYYLGRAPGPD